MQIVKTIAEEVIMEDLFQLFELFMALFPPHLLVVATRYLFCWNWKEHVTNSLAFVVIWRFRCSEPWKTQHR